MATPRKSKTPIAQATAPLNHDEAVRAAEKEFSFSANAMWQALGFRPPSMAETIITLIARVTLYAVGFTASLFAVAALSAVLQTWGWPLFIVMCLEIISVALLTFANWITADRVVDFVASGGVSRTLNSARAWCTTKFNDTSAYLKSRTVH